MGMAGTSGCTCMPMTSAGAQGAPGVTPSIPAPSGPSATSQATIQAAQGAQATTAQTGTTPRGAGKMRIASFNVLGASHTAAGGNKPGYRSGVERVPDMIAQLKEHDVDVAGLQEFQGSQQAAFRKANSGYALHGEGDNVIAYRQDRYRVVQSRSLTIPYFKGHPRKMPVVLLEDRRTGARSWVINVHNPADTKAHPRNAANRQEAMRREQALVRELQATGVPVLLVGDMNLREAARSTFTGSGMSASDPKQGTDGIDWVFGSQGVAFSDAETDHEPRSRKVSDHPIVVSTATY